MNYKETVVDTGIFSCTIRTFDGPPAEALFRGFTSMARDHDFVKRLNDIEQQALQVFKEHPKQGGDGWIRGDASPVVEDAHRVMMQLKCARALLEDPIERRAMELGYALGRTACVMQVRKHELAAKRGRAVLESARKGGSARAAKVRLSDARLDEAENRIAEIRRSNARVSKTEATKRAAKEFAVSADSLRKRLKAKEKRGQCPPLSAPAVR